MWTKPVAVTTPAPTQRARCSARFMRRTDSGRNTPAHDATAMMKTAAMRSGCVSANPSVDPPDIVENLHLQCCIDSVIGL